MRRRERIFIMLPLLLFLAVSTAAVAGITTLQGKVSDINGKAVEGAEVYVFQNANVKRPADFISSKTLENGRYAIKLSPGKYWATAILRLKDARFGPLATGDKHSGEPVIFEIIGATTKDAATKNIDFTVRNLREAALLKQKKSDTLLKVSGRIIAANKSPVAMAYVMADKRPKAMGMPQYFSAWTAADGAFIMYLPHGKFYLGVATAFPPVKDYPLQHFIDLQKDVSGLNIIVKE